MWRPTTGSSPIPLCPSGCWSGPRPPRSPRSAAPRPTCTGRCSSSLPEAVRTGRPYAMHEERRDESERWEAYIRGLFEVSRAEQDDNAALVPVSEPRRRGRGRRPRRLLDGHVPPSSEPPGHGAGPASQRASRPADRRRAGLLGELRRGTCSSWGWARIWTSSRSSTWSITCPRSVTGSCAGWRTQPCGPAGRW